MHFPKMTPKRWFWSALAAGLLWSLIGWRWDTLRAGTISNIQESATVIPRAMLIPPSYLLTSVQSRAEAAFDHYAAAQGTESADELREKLRALQDENAWLKNTIALYANI